MRRHRRSALGKVSHSRIEIQTLGLKLSQYRRDQGVLLAIDYPDFQRRGAPLTVAIIGAAKQRKLVGAAREVFGVRPQKASGSRRRLFSVSW